MNVRLETKLGTSGGNRYRGDGFPLDWPFPPDTGRRIRVARQVRQGKGEGCSESRTKGRKSRSRGRGQSVRIGWRLFSASTSISSRVFNASVCFFIAPRRARVWESFCDRGNRYRITGNYTAREVNRMSGLFVKIVHVVDVLISWTGQGRSNVVELRFSSHFEEQWKSFHFDRFESWESSNVEELKFSSHFEQQWKSFHFDVQKNSKLRFSFVSNVGNRTMSRSLEFLPISQTNEKLRFRSFRMKFVKIVGNAWKSFDTWEMFNVEGSWKVEQGSSNFNLERKLSGGGKERWSELKSSWRELDLGQARFSSGIGYYTAWAVVVEPAVW